MDFSAAGDRSVGALSNLACIGIDPDPMVPTELTEDDA